MSSRPASAAPKPPKPPSSRLAEVLRIGYEAKEAIGAKYKYTRDDDSSEEDERPLAKRRPTKPKAKPRQPAKPAARKTVIKDDSSDEDERPLKARQPKRAAPAAPAAPPAQVTNLLQDLQPELLEQLTAEAILKDADPCTRIGEICRTTRGFAEACRSDSLYNELNTRLGWYGPHGTLANVPESASYTKTNARAWFVWCCSLYRKYASQSWARQMFGTLGPAVDSFELVAGDQWLLDAIAASYNVYAVVADWLESDIDGYFDDVKTELYNLTLSESLLKKSVEAAERKVKAAAARVDEARRAPNRDDVELNTALGDLDRAKEARRNLDTSGDQEVAYLVGAFQRLSRFEELQRQDPTFKVLRDAMVTKPSGIWADMNLPMPFYSIVYNSRELVKILKSNSPAEIERNFADKIKKLFFEASYADACSDGSSEDCVSWFMHGDNSNDVAYDRYPRAVGFLRDLLIHWLRLPMLSGFVFDEGSDDAATEGNTVEVWGYFRARLPTDGAGLRVQSDTGSDDGYNTETSSDDDG